MRGRFHGIFEIDSECVGRLLWPVIINKAAWCKTWKITVLYVLMSHKRDVVWNVDIYFVMDVYVVGRLVNHTRTEFIPEASSRPFI